MVYAPITLVPEELPEDKPSKLPPCICRQCGGFYEDPYPTIAAQSYLCNRCLTASPTQEQINRIRTGSSAGPVPKSTWRSPGDPRGQRVR